MQYAERPKEVFCPECEEQSQTWFEDYQLGAATNPTPGLWVLDCCCEHCCHEWKMPFTVRPTPIGDSERLEVRIDMLEHILLQVVTGLGMVNEAEHECACEDCGCGSEEGPEPADEE